MSDHVTDDSGADATPPPAGPVPRRRHYLPQQPARTGVVTVFLTVLVGLWAVAMAVLPATVTWLFDQYYATVDSALPWWGWPLASVGAALFIALPALLLAQFGRAEVVRAIGRTWAASAALLGVLGSLRAVPVQHTIGYLLLLALVAAGAAVLLPRLVPAPAPRGWFSYGQPRTPVDRLGPAVAAGLAALLPFLFLASLGGLVETVAAALAATAVGWLVARLLHRTLWPALFHWSRAKQLWLGGLVAGVALVVVATGVGGTGVFLLEMLVLPPFGFVLAALRYLTFDRLPPARRPRSVTATAPGPEPESQPVEPEAQPVEPEAQPVDVAQPAGRRRSRLRVGGLTVIAVGLAAFGPLGFVSAAQAWAFLLLEEIGFWGGVAALCSLVITLLVALGYGLGLPRLRRPLSGAVLALVLLAGAGVAYASGAPGLHGDQLFVVMKQQADLTDLAGIADVPARRAAVYQRLTSTALRSQAGLRHELDRLHLAYTPYYLVNGVEVQGGPGVRALLSQRSDVDRVLLNPRLRPIPDRAPPIAASQPTPGTPVQPNLVQIGADKVWASGDTGAGVVVGSSDTGVDGEHEALAGNYRGGTDSWYDPWNHSTTPVDNGGHGTHTTATAVGAGGVGVAPGATWMACVNLDRDLANPGYYLDCLQYMLAPFAVGGDPLRDGNPARAADVLTNSWACTPIEGCDAGSLRAAVSALSTAGIFVVAAAGNSGPRCGSILDPPAIYPSALTVAAVDGSGKVAAFSSRGEPGSGKPDIAAPGVDILSAVPGGGYTRLEGTSMAAPHVAGVVALMWSANPALVGNIPATADLLRRTATPVPPTRCGSAAGSGAGLVDAYAAVAAARGYAAG